MTSFRIGSTAVALFFAAFASGTTLFAAAGTLTFNGPISMPESVTPASLQVVRLSGTTGTVTVDYATHDGTATAPGDYIAQSGTLTFADGETSKNINITVVNDSIFEAQEAFTVTLSNPAGGAALGSQTTAFVTINDDDTPPSLSINDVSMPEGNSGTTNMIFHVTLSAASPATTTVQYYASGGTAYSYEDFQYTYGTLTFNPGETQKDIAVPIYGDTRYENDEYFYVNLYGNTNATLARYYGIGTILNDDVRPTITIADVRVLEGDSGQTNAVITIRGNQPLYGELDYTISDGTARAGSDYVAYPYGYLYFYNETVRTIIIPIIGDTEPEPDETITVRFGYNSTGGTLDHNPVTVTIVNDDVGFGPRTQNVPLGKKASLSLNLGVRPAAAVTATMTATNSSVLEVPATLTITETTTVIELPTKALGFVTLTLTVPAPYSKTFTVDVGVYEPTNLVLKPPVLTLPEGTSLSVSASFDPALSSSVRVILRALDTSIVEVPDSVIIDPGGNAVFTVKALKKGSTALSASMGIDHGGIQQSTFLVDVTGPTTTPLITQLVPANGTTAGGTTVTINGANLAANCTMFFGDSPASSVTFTSASSMTATTPPHPAGTVDVLLTCGSDSFNFTAGFTYLASSPIISAVAPTFGSMAGGTLVRITGSNFRSGCWPFFDNAAARTASFISAAEMIGEVPPHSPGKVGVAIRCSGAADGTLVNGFTYSSAQEPAPLINSVTPLAGSPGQSVILTGARFRRDDVVKFDDLSAAILSSSPDIHAVRIPEMPAGEASITLIDSAGHATTTGPIFTVLEAQPPHINAATPTTGRPGIDVVLEGTGFRPGYSFAFGTSRATIISLNYIRVLLRVPNIEPGAYPLNVVNAGGKIASIGPSFTVTPTGPSINSISPSCARTDMAGTLTITGNGFQPGAVVTFDGTLTSSDVTDANTIHATIPPGAVGSPRIVVTNAGGESASLSGGFTFYSPYDPVAGSCVGGRKRPAGH